MRSYDVRSPMGRLTRHYQFMIELTDYDSVSFETYDDLSGIELKQASYEPDDLIIIGIAFIANKELIRKEIAKAKKPFKNTSL